MKILRYSAACLLTLILLVPMAGAIRLTKPTPPVPAETEAATEPVETPVASKPAEIPAASKPAETPVASKPAETPTASKPAETPAAAKPAETPAASRPAETPVAAKPTETPAAAKPAAAPKKTATADPSATAKKTGTGSASKAPEAEDDGAWKLLLVNPWNPLPEDFSVELVKLSSCGLKVDKRIREDLNAMYFACQKEGLHPVICSAYRTQATQTRLYNNKISRLRAAGYSKETALEEAGRWVAVPGTSEHQTGLALDIVSAGYQSLTRKQANTAEQKWLMEHCWEYGFILRYPEDKCDITGISYEPWHYRYVGKEAALAMRESGQCLEEYLESLEKETAQSRSTPRGKAADPMR